MNLGGGACLGQIACRRCPPQGQQRGSSILSAPYTTSSLFSDSNENNQSVSLLFTFISWEIFVCPKVVAIPSRALLLGDWRNCVGGTMQSSLGFFAFPLVFFHKSPNLSEKMPLDLVCRMCSLRCGQGEATGGTQSEWRRQQTTRDMQILQIRKQIKLWELELDLKNKSILISRWAGVCRMCIWWMVGCWWWRCVDTCRGFGVFAGSWMCVCLCLSPPTWHVTWHVCVPSDVTVRERPMASVGARARGAPIGSCRTIWRVGTALPRLHLSLQHPLVPWHHPSPFEVFRCHPPYRGRWQRTVEVSGALLN